MDIGKLTDIIIESNNIKKNRIGKKINNKFKEKTIKNIFGIEVSEISIKSHDGSFKLILREYNTFYKLWG